MPGCNAKFRQGTHLSAHKRLEHSGDSENSSPEITEQDYNINLSYITKLLTMEYSIIQEPTLNATNIEIKLSSITESHSCKLRNIFQ